MLRSIGPPEDVDTTRICCLRFLQNAVPAIQALGSLVLPARAEWWEAHVNVSIIEHRSLKETLIVELEQKGHIAPFLGCFGVTSPGKPKLI